MKKTAIIATLILSMAVVFIGCKDKRVPGRIYMPDMAYSRAYESYAPRDSNVFTMNPNNAGHKIFFNNLPPAGTLKDIAWKQQGYSISIVRYATVLKLKQTGLWQVK